jgi:hypothetical protein
MVALDVLNAAFSFLPANYAAQYSTRTSDSTDLSYNTSIVIGGVVGSVLGSWLIMVLVYMLCIRQRKTQSRDLTEESEGHEDHNDEQALHVEPFMYDGPRTGDMQISMGSETLSDQVPPMRVGHPPKLTPSTPHNRNPVPPSSRMAVPSSPLLAVQSSAIENNNEMVNVISQEDMQQPVVSPNGDVPSLVYHFIADLLQNREQPIAEEQPPRYE